MRILKQIGFIFGICLVGQIIAELIPVPFPGSVMSMVLLFILSVSYTHLTLPTKA